MEGCRSGMGSNQGPGIWGQEEPADLIRPGSSTWIGNDLPDPCFQIPGRGPDGVKIDNMDTITFASTDSPIGRLTVAARGSKVCLVHFGPISKSVRTALAAWYPEREDRAGRRSGRRCQRTDEVLRRGTDESGRGRGRTPRHAVSAARVERVTFRCGGHDDLVCATRGTGRRASGRACGRGRKRREPGRRRSPLPPNHRQQRQPHGLRRWAGSQALAARPRRGEAVAVLKWARPTTFAFKSPSPPSTPSTQSSLVFQAG